LINHFVVEVVETHHTLLCSMTPSSHCYIAVLIAALFSCVLADLPPVRVYCSYFEKIDDDEDVYPFYEETSYEPETSIVFDENSSFSPFIYPLFASANFTVENIGENDLTFLFTSSITNLTDNGAEYPQYEFEPEDDLDFIKSGDNKTFYFRYVLPYEGEDIFTGLFTAFMVFKEESTTYDPISFTAQSEVYVTGCPAECNDEGVGKGHCIEKVGFCKCEKPWTGYTCQSSFWMWNNSLCPGQPIECSYGFVATSCKGYWSIYDAEDVTTYDTGLLYEEETCVKDKFVDQTNLTIMTFLNPGLYQISYFPYFGGPKDGSVFFEVNSWEDCGNEYDCSEEPEDAQCNGHGECSEGECECSESHFWHDCSRGCGLETRLTARSAIIDSDSGTDKENDNPRYVQQTNCTWYIEPEGKGVDIIRVNFTRFRLASSGDILLVRSLNSNGEIDKNSKVLAKYSGTVIPQIKEFEAKRIALVFTTSYQGSSLGFRLNYDVITKPISGGVIAVIVIAGVLVAVCVVIGIVMLSVRNKRLRSEALKHARAAESEPWVLGIGEDEILRSDRSIGKEGVMPERYELEKILGWMDMKDLEFECSEYDLRFGLEERMPCPVMVEQKQVITITNASDEPLAFCFFHPVENYTWQCSLVPGKGTLAPGTGVRIQVTFKLMYTTRVDTSIKCAVWRGARGPGDFYAFATADGLCAPGPSAKPTEGDNENENDPYRAFQEALNKSEPLKTARLTIHLEGAVSERIDPSEVVLNPEPLGEGAYGVVYSGRYRGRFVAVKVMSRQHDLVEQITKDFEKEIDLYRRLHNPLVVEFIGASLIPGKLCMCTELIQRGSLEQLLTECEIPLALQLRFAMNVAEAVAFLHTNNVMHRDLKPSNIMVMSTSLNSKVNCKIGDFGTARNVKDVTEFFLYTQAQGTPVYMAPEMLAVKPYNCKADVYSFGVTLWQMAAREKPWVNVPVWDIPTRVIHGKRPQIPGDLPKDYSDLIRRCWASKPDDRPAFSEIVEMLGPIAKRTKKENKKDGKGGKYGRLGAAGESTVDFNMTLDESVRGPNSAANSPSTTTTTTTVADKSEEPDNHEKKKKKKKKKN